MTYPDETTAPLSALRAAAQSWADYARKWNASGKYGDLSGYVSVLQNTASGLVPFSGDNDGDVAAPELQATYASAFDLFSTLVDSLQLKQLQSASDDRETAHSDYDAALKNELATVREALDAEKGGFLGNLFGGFGDIFKSLGLSAGVVLLVFFALYFVLHKS